MAIDKDDFNDCMAALDNDYNCQYFQVPKRFYRIHSRNAVSSFLGELTRYRAVNCFYRTAYLISSYLISSYLI